MCNLDDDKDEFHLSLQWYSGRKSWKSGKKNQQTGIKKNNKETDPLFDQFVIVFTTGCIVPSLIEIGQLVFEIIFNENACKNGFPYCGPIRLPRTMVCTNLKLRNVRKLSCKSELFWPRRFLNEPTLFLHFCYYLHFEEDLALYLNNFDSLHPRIICNINLIEIGNLLLEKFFF
jgi:hypothetical protein